MRKYDIGILTFWNVPNYGTFAQAYALQKELELLNENRDIRQIAHLDSRHYNFYFNLKAYYRSFSVLKKCFWKSFFVKDNKSCENKKKMFLDSYDRIPHTQVIDSKNSDSYEFTSVFLGSDIIWDFSLEPFNNDPMLFGKGINASQINSYAASFGTITEDVVIPEYVISSIKRMKHISVRDENSADIIEKITGERPIVVLDPVWIWDFNIDDNVVVPNEEDYCLIYGQDFSKQFIVNLIAYSKEHNLKMIVLDCNNDTYEWCDKLIKQDELDPLEWIGYFKAASVVATSTFHGITFGLIFNKKIAFCKTDFIIAKIGALLKKLNIYDVFDDADDVYSMLDYSWDYSRINNIINEERIKSIEFLKKVCVD